MNDNKLIAEFMGYETTTDGISDLIKTKDYNGNGVSAIPNYHNSWELKIPVIKKIKSLNPPEKLGLEQRLNPYLYSDKSIYDAIVEYIKWYNKENA